MTVLRDLSIYWGMIHILILFVILFRSRYNRKKTVLVTSIGMGLLMAVNVAGFVVFGFEVLAKVFLFTATIPSFLLFYGMSADKRFKFLMSFCLADTTSMWVMAVTNLLDFYLGGGHYVLMLISRLIAFPLLEYLAWRYLRKPYMELQDAVEKGWGVFAGMTMLYYILLVVVVQFPTNIVERPEDTFLCVLILVLMLFNYATIFTALYGQLQLYRKQQSERILQEQKHILEAQLDNQQNIRRMKHNMKAHMVTVSGLLDAGKTAEAGEYLKRVETELETVTGQFCSNIYLNAVLGYYHQRFQELATPFRLDIQVGGEELPYMELCQILSNGLENAWDASALLSEEERDASVQMKYRKDYLILRIKNRCREELSVEKGTIPNTNKKGSEHGFGLLTIQEAAERLQGEMCCYTDGNCFLLDVMVRIKAS